MLKVSRCYWQWAKTYTIITERADRKPQVGDDTKSLEMKEENG